LLERFDHVLTGSGSQHGASQEDLFRNGPDAKGLSDSVFEIATLANEHAQTAKRMLSQPEFPKTAVPALLSLVCFLWLLFSLETDQKTID
jgi:hypothetical protein